MSYPFSFSLIASLEENTAPEILIEILGEGDLEELSRLHIDATIIDHVRENLKAPEDDREAFLSFSTKYSHAKKLSFIFAHGTDCEQGRCDILRSMKTDFTYVSFQEKLTEILDNLILATYRFEKYLSKKKMIHISLYRSHPTHMHELDERLRLLARVYGARDLVNTPSSHSNPSHIVEEIEKYPWKHTRVRVMKKKELQDIGMNLLLAVGAGSPNEPYVVIFERIEKKDAPVYWLAGKGVTFDSGGIQIKPWEAMREMKMDMSWAAAVIATMQYLDERENIGVNLISAIGLVENMTGGNAYKPLDIYTAYNGKTVEIHHTDAEWRLVLGDMMAYLEDVYDVEHIMTIATLTGACMYALGYNYAWIMGDDEETIATLQSISEMSEEKVWRLPFNERIGKTLKADFADLRNLDLNEKAGASVGAAFLAHFRNTAKLTHIDIAWPAYRDSPFRYYPKGATWWGVILLSEFFSNIWKK